MLNTVLTGAIVKASFWSSTSFDSWCAGGPCRWSRFIRSSALRSIKFRCYSTTLWAGAMGTWEDMDNSSCIAIVLEEGVLDFRMFWEVVP